MTEPTALTFEEGYSRLQTIAKRVTSEEVPVAEMCDLFAEGKGLQKSLTEYLEEQKSRVEAIERGEGIQAFRIVPPSDSDGAARDLDSTPSTLPAPDDFSPSVPRPSAPADDDIPF
jgi:exodeoxyribonuclease VII small subunit